MSLTIEDGSGVAGANSYVTDNEYVSYAAARGLTIATTPVARQIELIKSMDYIFNQEKNMRGFRTVDAQENAYPRQDVYIRNVLLDNDVIPQELKNAQMEGGAAANSFDLLINKTQSNIQRKKLDVMETVFFDGGSWETTRIERVDNYLRPLLATAGITRTVRS